MCFSGNPGTGKTETARILSRLLYDAGVLPEAKVIETDASGLIGKYVGEIVPKTIKKINEAMDGILFIDEAYALTDSQYGDEAVAALLKEMEDRRGQFCVILAGYKKEMDKLLSANPGFASRIQFMVDFTDYTREELAEIAVRFLAKKKYEIADNALDKVLDISEYYRKMPDFANARTIRNIFDQVIMNQNLRTDDEEEENFNIILKFLSNGQKQNLFKEFEGMCSESEIRKLISRIQLSDIAPPDLNLLDNLEKIHIIISEKRKINFDYGKFDVDKQMKYYSKRRSMIPCLVVYYDDHFYLKCINEEDEKVRTYRIDRMKNIKSDEVTHKHTTIPKPDGVVLDMFEPEYFELVTIKIRHFLLDDMLEQFGKYANIRHDLSDNDSVVVNVRVGISDSFYRWVMKYGSNIEILSPEKIRNNFIDELKKITEIYVK